MTKSFKTIVLIAGLLFGAAIGIVATPIANLDFQITSSTTDVPSAYTYSSANKPNIKTQNNIKCIIISDGGGSTAPTFSADGSTAPTGGKRWMAFSPDVNCSVQITVMSNKKKFYIQDKNGEFFTYTNTANQQEVVSVTGLQAGQWYAMCGGSSQVYVTKMEFTASGGPTPPPTPGQPSNDATLSDLKVDGTTISGFSANTISYTYTVASGVTTVPTVTATATRSDSAQVQINPATTIPGSTTVVVTAADGTTTKTYTVNFTQSGDTPPTPPTPPTPTTLTLHETEIYETPVIMGGYGGTLATYGGREYEVYYVNRDAAGSNMSISLVNTDKNNGITTGTSNVQCAANDGWLTAKGNGNSSASDNVGAEFGSMVRRINMQSSDSVVMHVKGFSELAIVAADNSNSDSKKMQVYVNGVARPYAANNSVSIRRYPLSTGENIIKIGALGTSNSRFYGFSLQVAYVPKLKHLKGNDSTQVVLQTAAIKPITYFLKNRISDAELTWNGQEATGISLVKGNNDTLYVQGTANCPVGSYSYTISAKDSNNVVVSSLSGSFSVESKVECQSGSLTMSVFANSAIKPVVFRCYTIDMSNATSSWTGATPAGLSFQKDPSSHTITLSGTPTVPGTYQYTVAMTGGNTLNGSITVKSDQPTILPGKPTLLYLYKDNENDGLYNYITGSGKYGYFARPAADDLGDNAIYSTYDAVVISEDVDATNREVLGIIRNLRKPVLNMKIFTYSANRLGWGDPDNGSVTNTQMHVTQATHPIFAGLNTNADVALLSGVSGNRGLMAADVNYSGSLCLAIVPTRGPNYSDEGDVQTFIHEVPAAKRGAKYLSLPIGLGSTSNLTAEGKKLFDNMISYLTTSTESGVLLPTLRITAFSANDVAGQIDEQQKTITVRMPNKTDLTAVRVNITLADNHTFVTPASGEIYDFSDIHYGVVFTVSDYINQVSYTAKVLNTTDLETTDADGLSLMGDILKNTQNVWVRIYAANGQLITTTNSDYSFAGQPRGMYIVRSENSTLKVLH
ncbi:MAG: hypothetical protein J6T19_04985 [Paludibacteraceae bacterium]|nr:hypothetical protein [Paludibacteraceae bacterium]